MKRRDKILIAVAIIAALCAVGCLFLIITDTSDAKTVPEIIIFSVICVVTLGLLLFFKIRDKKKEEAELKAYEAEMAMEQQQRKEAEARGEVFLSNQEKSALRSLVSKVPNEDTLCPVCKEKIVVTDIGYGTVYDEIENKQEVLDALGNTIGYLKGKSTISARAVQLKTYGCKQCGYKWHKANLSCFLAENEFDAVHNHSENREIDKDMVDWGKFKKIMD